MSQVTGDSKATVSFSTLRHTCKLASRGPWTRRSHISHVCTCSLQVLVGTSLQAQTVDVFVSVRTHPWVQTHTHPPHSRDGHALLFPPIELWFGFEGPICGTSLPVCRPSSMPVGAAPCSHPRPCAFSGSQVVCPCHSAPRRTGGAARAHPMRLPPLNAPMT